MRHAKHSNAGKAGNNGFTLLEILVVIMIIGVLMGISAVAFSSLRDNARKTRAVMTAKQLTEAWGLYIQTHGYFPIDKLKEFCSPVNGWYMTDTNFIRFKRYTERNNNTPEFYYDISGEEEGRGLLDPWKNPYFFQLDDIRENGGGGMTGQLRHPDGKMIKTLVLVWSYGPDKKPGRNGEWPNLEDGQKPADDIVVW